MVEPMDFNFSLFAVRVEYFVCGRHMDESRGERAARGARQGAHRWAARTTLMAEARRLSAARGE